MTPSAMQARRWAISPLEPLSPDRDPLQRSAARSPEGAVPWPCVRGVLSPKIEGGRQIVFQELILRGGRSEPGRLPATPEKHAPQPWREAAQAGVFSPARSPRTAPAGHPFRPAGDALTGPNALLGFVPTIDLRSFAQLAQLFPHSASAHSHNWLNCSHKQDSAPSHTRRDCSHTRNPPSQHGHPFPLGPSCDDFPH